MEYEVKARRWLLTKFKVDTKGDLKREALAPVHQGASPGIRYRDPKQGG